MRKLVAVFLLIMSLTIVGCSQKPTPEDRWNTYVKLWTEQQFDDMYDLLSEEAQANVSKEDFTARYEKIYSDLEIDNLNVSFNEEEEKDEANILPFSVQMDSIAGEITFDHQAELVKEKRDKEENWFVQWDTTFIFPELEEGDSIGLPTTPAIRGKIVDKHGTGLAVTGEVFEVGIVPGKMGEQETEVIQEVAHLLDIKEEQIEKELSASWVQPEHFVPIKKLPTYEKNLLDQLTELSGVDHQIVDARVYPLGEAAAHLIGYVGPITAEEMEEAKGHYRRADVIGKRGLEQVFEERLKGEHGAKIIIKKEDGSEVVLAEKEVKHGKDIQLTIDAKVQQTIFNEVKDEAGTATALHPVTGETLALVSSPSFDPNILSLGATAKQWEALQEDPKQPLVTRFNATYAPGSVLKPITAAIALQEGTTDWQKTIDVKGLTWQKDSSWGGYKVKRVTDPNAPVNLEKALIYSDNIYFAQTALDLSKDSFLAGLKSFGFEEELSSYAFPLEQSTTGKMDSEVALADSGYGQGQIEMSIVHLASTFTPFANKGQLIQPILLAEEEKGTVWKKNVINEDDAAKIQATLVKVVEDPKGTATAAKISGYPLAGKTGTAELKTSRDEAGKENGLFVAYNTEKNMIVALMIEHVEGRGGSELAVKKVKNIFEQER